jgi:hypothetical protein
MKRITVVALAVAALVGGSALPVRGQPRAAARILLDKPTRAGALTLFPDLADDKAYYYIADQPHLGTDENGRPQFSFLRWVDNVRTTADQAEAREGEGGGIVHAVVSLAVTPEQLRDAQRELQRRKAGARIVGSVPFTSGTFGLVSSFKDPKTGNLTTQVVGLGKAPLLDGEKAAISILLTKQGAKILWESFDTPTPDISFSFEMELQGYNSPLAAKIQANWDQIYDHEAFAVGFASTYVSAEITAAFDDLRREGAIKITQVGQEASMDAMVKTAYDKLTEIMFSKVDSLDPGQLAKSAAKESVLDKVGGKLKEERAAAETRNKDTRTRNEQIRARNGARDKAKRELDIAEAGTASNSGKVAEAQARADKLRAEAEAARRLADDIKGQWESTKQNTLPPIAPTPKPRAESSVASSGPSLVKVAVDRPSPKAQGGDQTCGDARACEQAYTKANAQAEGLEKAAKQAQADADSLKKSAPTRDAERERLAGEAREQPLEEQSSPGFALLATYEVRKVRQRGTFVLDLDKYLTNTLTTRFDENIGDLRRLKADAEHFRQVNLDDALFKQREIVAMVDGLDAKDFGEWINFVTVQLRKKHAAGAETTDEVRIDRNNFNTAGNAFKLLYGWNGDNDRRKWLDYEYRAIWSFFGGHVLEQPWKNASAGAIGLTPPLERRKVSFEADPKRIAESGARSITARVFYSVGGAEQIRQLILNVDKQQLSGQIEFLLPGGAFEYTYEIGWHMSGNKTVTSGRHTSSESILFVDELPTNN